MTPARAGQFVVIAAMILAAIVVARRGFAAWTRVVINARLRREMKTETDLLERDLESEIRTGIDQCRARLDRGKEKRAGGDEPRGAFSTDGA